MLHQQHLHQSAAAKQTQHLQGCVNWEMHQHTHIMATLHRPQEQTAPLWLSIAIHSHGTWATPPPAAVAAAAALPVVLSASGSAKRLSPNQGEATVQLAYYLQAALDNSNRCKAATHCCWFAAQAWDIQDRSTMAERQALGDNFSRTKEAAQCCHYSFAAARCCCRQSCSWHSGGSIADSPQHTNAPPGLRVRSH